MRRLALPWVPGIVSTPDTCFGRTRLEGTRIPVLVVVDALAAGDTEAHVMDGYRLTREQMMAVYELCRRFIARLP
ncbi:MAG: DUF433 domain-containing protein [Thermoleophilia bacterium]|nr:DUF433 domain-containing protein [Thermoleophilia bacterium]